jgi:hypothetical protein
MDEMDLCMAGEGFAEEEVQTEEEVESLETALPHDDADFGATVTAELLSIWIGRGPVTSAIAQPIAQP